MVGPAPGVGKESARPIRWPDFVYIGVSRAGSTWLYQVLAEHPDIAMPRAKEIQFFDKNYHRGARWYGDFFAATPRGKLTGEIWHDYFLDAQVAGRMRAHCPGVKIIATLREPADWAQSRWAWAREVEDVGGVALDEYVRRPGVVSTPE